MSRRAIIIPAIAMICALSASSGMSAPVDPEPLVIRAQGSFAVGGTVQSTPGTYDNNAPTAAGQSFHGDHLYAFFQVPENARPLPIVMLHGAYVSGRSWETTYDGRETITQLAFYAGWPNAIAAVGVAREVFKEK